MKTKWVVGLALAIVPGALMAAPTGSTAQPGTVNYVEGQVTINGKTLSHVQNGSTALAAGQTLSVANGKAEILLTPGSFLRVGNGADVRMVSTDLADPQVEIARGEALVEVNYKPKAERLDVREAGADTLLLKEGLYRFNADQKSVQVIDGKASVDQNGQNKDIGKGKELTLAGTTLKPASFKTQSSEDELYRWSSVRDSYLAQASEATARNVYVDGGWGYGYGYGPDWGLGWAWNPYYGTYAWLPDDGYFWSPFGYPFFAPSYITYAPIVRYRGFPGRFSHVTGAAVPGRVGAFAGSRAGAFRSGAAPRIASPGGARGFAGGGGFRGGGGFHGGGGGFHGGGGGRR